MPRREAAAGSAHAEIKYQKIVANLFKIQESDKLFSLKDGVVTEQVAVYQPSRKIGVDTFYEIVCFIVQPLGECLFISDYLSE